MRYLLFAAFVVPTFAELPPIPGQLVSMQVDARGRIWMFGSIDRPLFRGSAGAVQPNYAGGECLGFGFFGGPFKFPCPDLFVARLNQAGTEIEAATYLGGTGMETLRGAAIGADGAVYVAGTTTSGDFPPGQSEPPARSFVVRLPEDLTRLEYFHSSVKSSFLDVAGMADGSALIAESLCPTVDSCTQRVLRLNKDGVGEAWGRAAGIDAGVKLSVAPDGESLWVAGSQRAVRMSTADGRILAEMTLPKAGTMTGLIAAADGIALAGQIASDGAFLTRLSNHGAAKPVKVGYFLTGLARDSKGTVHVAGLGRFGVPMTEKSIARCAVSGEDAYVLGWNPAANSLVYGTFVPGMGGPVAVRGDEVFLFKRQVNAEVTTIRPAEFEAQPACVTWPVLNYAGLVPNNIPAEFDTVAPGEFVTVYGSGIGPASESRIEMNGTRTAAPREIGGSRILFNGVPAALIAAGPGKFVAQVPYEVAGAETVAVQVEDGGAATAPVSMKLAPTMPALFSESAPGSPLMTIYNTDWTLNSSQRPAKPGDVVTFFVSGGGRLESVGDDSAALPAPAPNALEDIKVAVSGSGGQEVTFAGGVPGQLPGLLQVNFRLGWDFAYHGRVVVEVYFGKRPVHADFWVE